MKCITWASQLMEQHLEVLFLKKEQKGMCGKRKSRRSSEKLPLEGGQSLWRLPFFSHFLKLIFQLFKVTALLGRGAPI